MFLLEWLNQIVVRHVDEHFHSAVNISGFHNEALKRLNNGASLLVNDWVSISVLILAEVA